MEEEQVKENSKIYLKTPYLDAIQSIPGESAHDKYCWIAVEIKARIAMGANLEEIVKMEQFPRALYGLIKVEAAKILNRTGHTSQSNYEAIEEGLKSENTEIFSRSLQAKEFFNNITDFDYFSNNLLHHVSYNTRCKIIKKLAHRLAGRNPQLAEEFFDGILSSYGVDRAMPILVACSKLFIKDVISKQKLVLSIGMVNLLYKRYPDLIVWYLKLSNPALNDPLERRIHHVKISEYKSFLPKLIRRNLSAFVEIYEMHSKNSLGLHLSRKQANRFAWNAKKYYLDKPNIFYKLLIPENISEEDMKIMFPKMLPDKIEDFNTNRMLQYLRQYPKAFSVSLLLKSYENVYGMSLLDEEKIVTAELMKILPAEERVRQAKIKTRKHDEDSIGGNDKFMWRCFLPANEVLPKIRERIAKTSDMFERKNLVSQMLFCCKVNEDDESLLEVLKYVQDRHRNEMSSFHHAFLVKIQSIYDTLHLSLDHWSILFEIIQRMYAKAKSSDFINVPMDFLETAVRFRLNNNLPPEPILKMMFFVLSRGYQSYWNVLTDYPEYERLCLLHFLRIAEQMEQESWNAIKTKTIPNLIMSIYRFNERHAKVNDLKIEFFSMRDYPWIFNELFEMLKENRQDFRLNALKTALKKNEIDIYNHLWPSEPDIVTIDINTMNQLKKDPKRILSHWETYYDLCRKLNYNGAVHRFVRSLRWYNTIPIKFAERCVDGVLKGKNENLLVMLGSLVHGETFAKFIEPLLPTEKMIDMDEQSRQNSFSFLHKIPYGMEMANPPVPLELIGRLCEGDYLSSSLSALNNSCRRTSVTKVIPFAKHLCCQRVTVAKHGIRLIAMVTSLEELIEFLSISWKQQEHHSVRKVVFDKVKHLFRRMPSPSTWGLMKMIISTISEKEESLLLIWPFDLADVPNDYITEYLKIVLEMIDRLEGTSKEQTIKSYIISFLRSIDLAICNILPDEFLVELFRRYLFNETCNHANPAYVARALLINLYLETTGDNLDRRLDTFSKIFVDAVKSKWNMLDSTESPHYYPIRNSVRTLITEIVYTKMKPEARSLVIDRVMETFLSVLTHEDDAQCYLLLIYAQEWNRVKTPKEFATEIGKKLSELIEIYTPLFSYFIADALKDFLKHGHSDNFSSEYFLREFVETLSELGTVEASYTAAQVLFLFSKESGANCHLPVLRKLAKTEHPAIKSLVNHIQK
ncbi:uncharacterized protein LOC136041481 [Artemia franciscana]|uniref:Uncharacterized protein n=1 Tax=Artemia franciscana TaxID=6661 RepID=A0AA88HEK9_ARTSF|nr:hypothetical protein QYM36_017795 [Artemia franciscana]KAK2703865.1 hypothetical protein QYM36_017795 [Artemia franciscana]KAK2703866.1 hypothetical protein QYM36_017795 [Artemia franciscana]KAK2703867.1 hypothetical protein QYM36_017795 [Artemia franciscana]